MENRNLWVVLLRSNRRSFSVTAHLPVSMGENEVEELAKRAFSRVYPAIDLSLRLYDDGAPFWWTAVLSPDIPGDFANFREFMDTIKPRSNPQTVRLNGEVFVVHNYKET